MGVAGRSRPSQKVKGSPVRESVRRSLGRVRRAQKQAHLPRIPFLTNRIGRSSAAAIEGLSPEAALHARRNFRLGVMNGIMFTLVEAIIAPSIVLAWFINRLGAPNALVGLLPAILAGGWFLPQILVASRVQGLPLVMRWYRTVGIIRIICMGLLVPSTILFADQPFLLLISFFVLYIIYAFGAGISGIPWLEMVSKIIPARRRGTFFGLRSFWGSMAGLLVAGPVAAIMSEQLWGLTFPYNFALLFGLAAVVVGLGVWCWSSIREPAATISVPQITTVQLLKRGVEVLKIDRDYRSFMVARILISLAAVADPFYVVYAKTHLSAPPATVGLYLGSVALSSLLSNFLWSPLADRAGNRMLMTMTVLSVAVVPLTALVLSLFTEIVNSTVLFTAFAAVFVLSGLALGASRIVNNNMLLTIAPAEERATYIGFLNLILGIVIFVPVLGGVLADVVGFRALFFLSLVLAGLALLATARMSTARAEQ